MKVAFPAKTDQEKFLLLFFGVCVAGKLAADIQKKVNELFAGCEFPREKMFMWVKTGVLREKLEAVKMDKYLMISAAMKSLRRWICDEKLDLSTCTEEDLVKIDGVGPKTANLFLMYSRDGFNGATLDTHVLKWLARRYPGIPKQTPSGERYDQIRDIFLAEAKKWGMTPGAFDWLIWTTERDKAPVLFWGEVFDDPDEVGESEYRAVVDTCQDGLSSEGVNFDRESHTQLSNVVAKHLEGMLVQFLDTTVLALRNLRRRIETR